MRCVREWLAAALVVGALCGCSNGDGRLTTKGRIVKGGAPFTVAAPEYIRVTFFPVMPDDAPPRNTYIAAVSPADGTFRAVGPDGKGIPPGKYRIAVEHELKRKDLFKGVYDGARSPFVFDIDSSTPEIVLDLDKK